MPVVGIDLGTTNTVVAMGQQVLPVNPQGDLFLPSVVAYPPSGETLVGKAALERRGIDPANTIYSSKRIIGQTWYSPATKEFRERYRFDLRESPEGEPMFHTRAGDQTPVQVATTILRSLITGGTLPEGELTAMIAVPSLFRQAQIDATIQAGRDAGFAEIRIIREPSATAAACLEHLGVSANRVAVYDLGGGTFDVAVIDCTQEPFEVLSHGGDIFLGGDDVDLGLANWAAQEVLTRHRWDLRDDPVVFARLVAACERVKIALSTAPEAELTLEAIDPSGPLGGLSLDVSRSQLNQVAMALVRRTFIICDEVLMQAGVPVSELDAVFLAGGATLLEAVQQGVTHYFRRDVALHLDPMHVVALGAAIKGADNEATSLPHG